MTWTPRLRTVLLLVNVIILAMPLGAIAALRIYDSELIRQTEVELIAQGAFVQATFAEAIRREVEAGDLFIGALGRLPETTLPLIDEQFIPLEPRLDANDEDVLPPGPDPIPASAPPHPAARRAGETLEPILTQAKQITFAGIRVVDADGTVVASTAGEHDISIHDYDEVQKALSGEFVSVLRRRELNSPQPALDSISRGTNVRVFVAMPVLVEEHVVGAVLLSRTPVSITKALYQRRYVLGGMLAVLLFGVLLITRLTAVTIQRPLRALLSQTRKLAANPGAVEPLARPGTHEFAELSEAFTTMASTLHQREQYLTTFARNVSHEFKTPLTSMRGSVELLQDHLDEMSAAERDDFLTVLADDCVRLDRLVSDLLQLAHADVQRPQQAGSNLHDELLRCAQELESSNFTVSIDCPPHAAVAMSAEALYPVLSNLIGNARAHGARHVEVTVVLADDVLLTITDDGPGIPADLADRIFEEFFTTARDHGGTGLGLAIIRSMVHTHGGEVRLVDPARARFELRLPAQ